MWSQTFEPHCIIFQFHAISIWRCKNNKDSILYLIKSWRCVETPVPYKERAREKERKREKKCWHLLQHFFLGTVWNQYKVTELAVPSQPLHILPSLYFTCSKAVTTSQQPLEFCKNSFGLSEMGLNSRQRSCKTPLSHNHWCELPPICSGCLVICKPYYAFFPDNTTHSLSIMVSGYELKSYYCTAHLFLWGNKCVIEGLVRADA